MILISLNWWQKNNTEKDDEAFKTILRGLETRMSGTY